MEFDVAPQPLRPSGWRRVALVVTAVIAVVGIAVATADAPVTPPGPSASKGDQPPTPVAAAQTPLLTSPQAPAPREIGNSTQPILPPPEAIACRDLDAVTCGQVVRAALTTVTTADGPVIRISASHSLLCNDDIACSPAKLARNQPLGSAVVSLGSDAQVWVNVVAPAPDSGRVWEPVRTTAWIVRWVP